MDRERKRVQMQNVFDAETERCLPFRQLKVHLRFAHGNRELERKTQHNPSSVCTENDKVVSAKDNWHAD